MDEPSYVANYALDRLSNYFAGQSEFMQLRTISSVIWLLGAIIDNKHLFFIGMAITILATLVIVVDILLNKRDQSESLRKMGMSSSFVSLFSHWAYTGWFNPGPDEFLFFGFLVSNYSLSRYAILGFILLWLSSRSLDTDGYKSGLSITQLFLLLVAGIAKAIIILTLIDSIVIKSPLIVQYSSNIAIFYILEPLIRYVFASTNKIVSSKTLMITESKFPFRAARDSIISNTILFTVTIYFNPQFASRLDDLLSVMIIISIFLTWLDYHEYNNYVNNPLARSPIGSFLNNIGVDMKDQKLKEKTVAIVSSKYSIDLSPISSLEIKENSLLVPLKETSDGMEVVLVGKGGTIVNSGESSSYASLDGITALLIPRKDYKEIFQKSVKLPLSSVDPEELEIPSLDSLYLLFDLLGESIMKWTQGLKLELRRYSLPVFGVHESKEITKVNIPGFVQVIEGKGVGGVPKFTKVKFPFGTVFETEKGSLARIAGMTFIDMEKVSFVDIPGILTVFEAEDVGSIVQILGFRVGENLDSNMIHEVKRMMLKTASTLGTSFDASLDAILADHSPVSFFNMTWDGQFQPLLLSSKVIMTNHPELPSAIHPFGFLDAPVDSSHKSLPKPLEGVEADYEVIEE